MINSAKLPMFGASLAMAVLALSPVEAASRTAKRSVATASQEPTGSSDQRSAEQERTPGTVVPEKAASAEQSAPKSLAEALFGSAQSKGEDQAALKARRIKAGIIAIGENQDGSRKSAHGKAVAAKAKAGAIETASAADVLTVAAAPEAGSVRALIAQHAARNGIPPALADAVVRVESRYNAAARNGVNLGLTQISLSTARAMGYSGAAAGLLDADTNLRYGMLYLAQAYRLSGGDTCRTILKYQAGHRATSMTGAARSYCAKVKTTVAAN
ncbi:lytic transglycosylase [Alsobacter soli]|uniref:Lytic transglycosylase n=1 Tax=Alsobacter soli TaxID=2109933 RepID=A0A2T1HTU2_9HYPH|nr:lytic transglycosylase domain-containing protein [Alsobacter soli]PSC05083.1 lytic transglycosylase [Alsobacter soli]